MRQNLRKNIKIDGEKVTPAMKVKHVHFSYGKNKILNGVSFQIEEGKVTTIMGVNGCGKSTLFSLMTKNLSGKGQHILKRKEYIESELKTISIAMNLKFTHTYSAIF